MLNRACLFLLPLLLLGGCHAAGPTALKVAKAKMKIKAAAARHGYRCRAVTAMEKQYDANHNGVIDPVEAMALRQQLMYEQSLRDYRKMDLNGDGLVDVDEYESFHPPR